MKQQKILIKGTNWLGDIVISLPAIKSLREENPDVLIAVLSKKNIADIYNLAAYVDAIVEYDFGKGVVSYIKEHFRLRQILKKNNFDKVYVFPNSFHSAFLAFLSGAKERIGYARDMRSFMLTDVIKRGNKNLHQVFSYLKLTGKDTSVMPELKNLLAVNDDLKEQTLRTFFSDSFFKEEDVLIGIAPGAAFGGAKRLPVHKYVSLIKNILKAKPDVKFVLMGSFADKECCDLICEEAGSENIINLAGKTSLEEAACICAFSNLFLSNDSGLMHLASVMGTKVVAFFGPTKEDHTAPLGAFEIIRSDKSIDCVPCMKRECLQNDHICMESIDMDKAFSVILKNL